MNPVAERAAAWLTTRREEMEKALEDLVNIDSNSFDKTGTDNVAQAIIDLLAKDGIHTQRIPNSTYGDVVRAEISASRGGANAPVLILGHRDTVFAKGTTTTRGFTRDGDMAFGPGVADMKGGLVVNMFALRALKAAGGANFPVVALFTSDEEIGSPSGQGVIQAHAKGARACFNTEPGRASGNVVTGRKGGLTVHVTVKGKAAHSGANHADGASAIGALAAKITAFHALTDYEAGITTNVGVIHGGRTHNTVAPDADCELDVRFITFAQREEVLKKIEAIVAREDVPGTSASMSVHSSFLPLEKEMSAPLFAPYQENAKALGFDVDGEFTGGCADSGFTAALGVPSLCGLGPVGGKAHTDEEWCRLDTLVPRAQALVATIAGLD